MTEEQPTPPHEETPPANETNETPQEEVTILSSELDKLCNDAKEFKDKYLRLLAETENTRKRLHKEKQDTMKFAIRDLIIELLNPIDHMEKALGHSENASEEVKHWAVGFKMIVSQFKGVLANYGVHSFESVGKEFDPHLHDAVETVAASDEADGTILEEFIKGYQMGDITIRPARVKVVKASPSDERETGEENTLNNNSQSQ